MSAPLSPGGRFDRLFLLKNIEERSTKNGKPYLSLLFGTPEGDHEARVWDMDLKSLPGLAEGDPVHASGAVQLYQDKVQLIVDSMEKAGVAVDPRDIYPSSPVSDEDLRAGFEGLVGGISGPGLRALMDQMRKDEKVFNAFFVSPAARAMHHARIGGLAQHSIDVCRLALSVFETSPGLDRDMLTVGALLHDIGKTSEYEVAGDFRYTLEGKFLGHISSGVSIVKGWIGRIPGFPERLALEVLHIILSHHGQLDLGSPKVPVTPEALVVHYADDLDAKLDMIRSAAGQAPGGEAFVRGLRRTFQFREGEENVQRPTSNVQRGEAQGEGDVRLEGPKKTGEDDDQGELF